MRVKTFFRTLRILSAIVLFFFCWTYMPLYSLVAYAATSQGQGSGGKGQGKTADPSQSPLAKGGHGGSGDTTGERFEKTLDTIREKIGQVEVKAQKNQDASEEIGAIKTKRAEIESADVEFKKEFAATEKKLKDAKLPKEILDRHTKFVKHYEEHLKEQGCIWKRSKHRQGTRSLIRTTSPSKRGRPARHVSQG
jgi:hypothetical protein